MSDVLSAGNTRDFFTPPKKLSRRGTHTNDNVECKLGIVYDRLVKGTFPTDEQVSKQEFIDYFQKDALRGEHHIEYDNSFTYYLAWNDLPVFDAVFIQAFVVEQNHRNKGLGSRVFRNWFKTHGNPKAVLEIDNEGARRFWEREGFIVNDEYEHYQPALGPGKTRVRMPLAMNFVPSDIMKLDNVIVSTCFTF